MNPRQHPSDGDADGLAAVRSLLAVVRRRLWIERLVAALRTALWSWTAILAIAAVLHLASGQPGLMVALVVATVAGLAALGWAALRRPGEAESALFADRCLGGESAYSTWLEARADAGPVHDTPALRRLAQWTAAAAPRSRSALGSLRVPLQLVRPLVAAVICTVVAALVTALPTADHGAEVEPSRQVGEPSQSAEPLSLGDDALARELAAELSTTLSSQNGPADAVRGSMQPTRDDQAATSAAVAGESSAVQAQAASGDARPATATEAAVAVADVELSTAASHTADETGDVTTVRTPGSGREAGTTRDESAGTAGSRALQGALAVQRREVIRPGEDSARQADMEQAGLYEGDAAASGEAVAFTGAAAARPPAARRTVALTPAEAAFATAWAETARSMRTQPR